MMDLALRKQSGLPPFANSAKEGSQGIGNASEIKSVRHAPPALFWSCQKPNVFESVVGVTQSTFCGP